ncbi:MAG TPA: ankyrin repeat domain-containing protein [Thermoanaerobaculia bacterium]
MQPLVSFILLLAASGFIGSVRSGDVPAVRQMLARGADPNAAEGANDWTPLLHAIHKNQLGSVEALLDGHANPNLAVNGMTPLMMSAGYGYTPIVRLLLARGADPRIRDLDGWTAVDYAVSGMTDIDRFTFFSCQDDTVRALIAGHAPREITTRWRRWGAIKGCSSISLFR